MEFHVEKEWTGSGLTNAKKEGIQRSEKREGDMRERGETRVLTCGVFVRKMDAGEKGRIGRTRRGGEEGSGLTVGGCLT